MAEHQTTSGENQGSAQAEAGANVPPAGAAQGLKVTEAQCQADGALFPVPRGLSARGPLEPSGQPFQGLGMGHHPLLAANSGWIDKACALALVDAADACYLP